MLRLSIHSGHLSTINPGNLMATLDIAYRKLDAEADYSIAYTQKGTGSVKTDELLGYPRWSASLWDLVARALTRVLYRADQAPPPRPPIEHCAYATRLCGYIEKSNAGSRGIRLATVEISQDGMRGDYTVIFREDIMGDRAAGFSYGRAALMPADLLLRAICEAYGEQGVLGPKPQLNLPVIIKVDDVEMIDTSTLSEPASTGFARFRGINFPATNPPSVMAKGTDFVVFLMRG